MLAGSLCTGYGGLDMAVCDVFGAELAWYAETDPAAARILAHRHPGVVNLGDITMAAWRLAPPVDILCAGFPCQPASQAGQKKGTDDERWLWPYVAEAARDLDPPPRLLVLENVPGLLTANGGRAFGDVVRGLARLGYVGRYGLFRADDTGAPHQRKRLFVVAAYPGHRPVAERSRGARRTVAERPPVGEVAAERGQGPVAARRHEASADAAGARRRESEDGDAGR